MTFPSERAFKMRVDCVCNCSSRARAPSFWISRSCRHSQSSLAAHLPTTVDVHRASKYPRAHRSTDWPEVNDFARCSGRSREPVAGRGHTAGTSRVQNIRVADHGHALSEYIVRWHDNMTAAQYQLYMESIGRCWVKAGGRPPSASNPA